MKKCIEKLIGRLEENIFVAELHGFGWDGQRVSNLLCLGDVKDISEQLAEEYNNGWIPCSERLPKDEELSKRKEVIVQNIHGEVFTARYTYNCAHTRKDFFGGYCAIPHIVAWQPLPTPYQPKGEAELYRAKSIDGEYQEYNGDWN